MNQSLAAVFILIIVLALATATRFGTHLRGAWHAVYAVSAAAALYFNVLVSLGAFETEPTIVMVQSAVALPFVGVAFVIMKRFAGELCPTASSTARSMQRRPHGVRKRSPR